MESSAEGSAYVFDKGCFDLVQCVLPLLSEIYCSQVMRAPWENKFSNWGIKDYSKKKTNPVKFCFLWDFQVTASAITAFSFPNLKQFLKDKS